MSGSTRTRRRLGIMSIVQDAQAHGRWHPLGDGYQPLPGDWVLFNGHVEVVTKYADGVLSTIGGDSLPNFSVNAHEYPGPLAGQGVTGFVSNGNLPVAATRRGQRAGRGTGGSKHTGGHPPAPRRATATRQAEPAGRALAAVPGTATRPRTRRRCRRTARTFPECRRLRAAAGARCRRTGTGQRRARRHPSSRPQRSRRHSRQPRVRRPHIGRRRRNPAATVRRRMPRARDA